MGVLEFMSSAGVRGYGEDLSRVSHGESFLQTFEGRFQERGLYILDEPEAGLTFEAQLHLLTVMDGIRAAGGQAIGSTHSPVLTSLPGAGILELSSAGIRPRRWAELDLVENWRAFLSTPDAFLRELLRAGVPGGAGTALGPTETAQPLG